MELFAKIFLQNVPSQMFNRVQNTTRGTFCFSGFEERKLVLEDVYERNKLQTGNQINKLAA